MYSQSKRNGKVWLSGLAAVLLLPSLAGQAQTTITNGLVAYWNFDNKDVTDSWGTFDGTANGTAAIPFVAGKTGFGQAIDLDGVDQFVEITGRDATYDPDQLAFAGGSVSISCWFTVESFDIAWQALIAKGEGSNWRVARDNGAAFMSYAGGLTDATGTKDVSDGNWHHLVAISDANGAKFGTALYVDGVLDGSISGQAVLVANAANMKIGDNPGATGRYWHGKMDDVAIWNRVLADAEISALYANGTGLPVSSFIKPAGSGTVTITAQPAAATALEGTTATFTVTATHTGSIPPSYQWRTNGVDIANATDTTYTTPMLLRTDTGTKISVKVSVPGQSVVSNDALLTVTPDMSSPTIASATGGAIDQVTLVFNKPMDSAGMTNTANFTLDNGVTVSSLFLLNSKSVVVTTSMQTAGTKYTVTVNNVKDIFGNTIAASSKATFTKATIDTGLVAYWTFDGDLKDAINGFDGTAQGTNAIAFVAGKFGKAIQLDGTDQYVDITGNNSKDNLSFDGASVSIACWFTADSFDKSWQALVAKGEGNDWRVARDNANTTMSYAGGLTDVAGAVDVSDGGWHHLVAISDATGTAFGTALYIDGVQDGNQPGAAVLTKNGKDVFIGENPDSSGRQWNGKIDDMAIWNRVLSESEIGTLYNNGTGKALGTLIPAPAKQASLSVTRSATSLTISWTPAGGTLESTPALGLSAVWSSVGTTNPATVTIGKGNLYYRVRN